MSANLPSDLTVTYYDTHAREYARDTLGVDMAPLHEPFLALVPTGRHILDAGCGSGRDTLAFLKRGYRVTAFDASAALARLAGQVSGLPVAVLRFQDVNYQAEFDGIWACASLLHVPRREIGEVFTRLTQALRPGGVWYMSFKVGEGQAVRDGRFFNDLTDRTLRELIDRQSALAVLRTWQTQDVRQDRRGTSWVNALVKRVLV
jgi:SAM-dependent methyltransferase